MTHSIPRITLADSIRIAGLGLHSGTPVSLTIHPGDNGFELQSASGRTAIDAEAVTDTRRCTCLASLATIEHMMSALAGCGITDAVIEPAGAECPGLDGSALPYVQAIQSVGTTAIGHMEVTGPFARIFKKEDEVSVAVAAGAGHWRYTFATDGRWPGEQTSEFLDLPRAYSTEVAPARTFCFDFEVPTLREHGLGQGLDESSALVLGPDGPVNIARFPDEPARHKLLDLIGDLALAGAPVAVLDVVAERSGHTMNVAAAVKLSKTLAIERFRD